jgi:predicted ATPase/DNA-binding CsgD family transcriptional regulator
MDGEIPAEAVATPALLDGLRAPARSLPSKVSSFIGRDEELVALARLIEAGRLVTITGPGGSGKTRLAIEVAARHAAGGIPYTFVDLAPVPDEQLIVSSIAAALGVQLPDVDDPTEALIGHGRGRPEHLVLDNLEHLPAAGPIVAGLLTRWSTLDVIATSRAPLHVQGEQLYSLGPMRVPEDEDLGSLSRLERIDAVRLFVERARSMDPGFAITDENARAISEICIRLDGLPLAIELAAARTRARPPAVLLAQLEPLLPLLSDGPLDVPLRQQTVQATIAWSFNLLSPLEQRLFSCLGVFVGGFTRSACEAVVPAGGRTYWTPTPTSILERLVDHSLLVVRPGPDGETRFIMLETIREFALSRLTPVRTRALRDRHLAFFLGLAEDSDRMSRGPEQVPQIRRLLVDQANARAALAWARETGDGDSLARLAAALEDRFWYAAGGIREGLSWLQTALEVEPAPPPALRAKLLQRAGLIARELGLRERSIAMFEAALAAATDGNDELGMAEAIHMLMRVAFDDPAVDFDLVAARLDEATAHALRSGVARPVVDIRVTQGEIARRRGDLALARSCFDDAIGVARKAEDASVLAYALLQLGFLNRFIGDYGAALASLGEAQSLAGQSGDKAVCSWATFGMARTSVHAGQLEAARRHLGDGVRMAADLRNARERVLALHTISEWLVAAGEMPAVVECWAAYERARVHMSPPFARDPRDQAEARAREVLGPVRFRQHWAIGEARGLEEAVEAAMAVVDSVDLHGRRSAATSRTDRFDLTGRELEVIALVAAGMPDGEIADALVISKKTASTHVANIKSKLGAGTRVEIALIARRAGLD